MGEIEINLISDMSSLEQGRIWKKYRSILKEKKVVTDSQDFLKNVTVWSHDGKTELVNVQTNVKILI